MTLATSSLQFCLRGYFNLFPFKKTENKIGKQDKKSWKSGKGKLELINFKNFLLTFCGTIIVLLFLSISLLFFDTVCSSVFSLISNIFHT